MTVLKRSGVSEPIDCQKITERLARLCARSFRFPRTPWSAADDAADVLELPALTGVDCVAVATQVAQRVYPGVRTSELDKLSIELTEPMVGEHLDYMFLAGRLAVSCLHKDTEAYAPAVWRALQQSVVNGQPAPLLSAAFLADVAWLEAHAPQVFARMDFDRDYQIEYFGAATLRQAYLLRLRSAADPAGRILERPQTLFMRVAVALHGRDAAAVAETYDLLSLKQGMHATPTLFNAGTTKGNLASCFLLPMVGDSIEGIYDTLKECAMVSKSSGGIGLSVSNVRTRGSGIRSTGGTSSGLVPMLKVFESTAKYVDQGGGKRPGSIAVYLEPWHPDVMSFLRMKLSTGLPETRADSLFYALWIPDLFMHRLQADADWSLFCPDACPGLNTCHGADFEALYARYEREGRAHSTVKARAVWEAAMRSVQETGMPYLLYKDAVNRASAQANLGTIRSSNLCCEIVQYTDENEIAVCNLASIALPSMVRPAPAAPAGSKRKFVEEEEGEDKEKGDKEGSGSGSVSVSASASVSGARFDFAQLERVAYAMIVNLNRVLDVGTEPLAKAAALNARHRPLGLGVQGLADAFCLLGLDFDSPAARALHLQVSETLYYGAVRASADLAERDGAYASFAGSPASRGLLQFDLATRPDGRPTSSWAASDARHDWTALKARIVRTGLRNSLLVAIMPTASTSQILGFNECIEPYTSNLYTRRTLAGVFTVVNRHMVRDLAARGLWNAGTMGAILRDKGSVQNLPGVPEALKRRYRTAYEMKMVPVMHLAADRQAFVCQSQSMNQFVSDATSTRLTQMFVYAWKIGLKTGVYYTHCPAKTAAQQFSVVPAAAAGAAHAPAAAEPVDDPACIMCSA